MQRLVTIDLQPHSTILPFVNQVLRPRTLDNMFSSLPVVFSRVSRPSLSLPLRHFAWNAKWKQKAPRKKNKRKSEDQLRIEKLKEKALRREQTLQKKLRENAALMQDGGGSKTPTNFVPPALLLPTGSPNVFISKIAAQDAAIDPRELFPAEEMNSFPSIFRENSFAYDGVETLDGKGTSSSPSHNSVPKVVFLGRSNVGKSSLVNALMRRDLARCSKQPGRTKQVHRFALTCYDPKNQASQPPLGIFLDLPGYGYAVAPDQELEGWQSQTQRVLRRERWEGNLRRVYLLLDARQGVKAIDQNVLEWLEETAEVPHTVVFTKSDAVAKPQLIKGVNEACLWYQKQMFLAEENDVDCLMSPVIFTTSSKGSGQGLAELLSAIEVEFVVQSE